jgi:hypothetical protein
MNHLLDGTLVGLALLASVAYAAAAFGPRTWRRALLAGLAWMMGRMPAFLGLRLLAGRVSAAAYAQAKGSCGGCGTCAADAAPGAAAGSAGATGATGAAGATAATGVTGAAAGATRAAEISVPVAKIGRRALKAP